MRYQIITQYGELDVFDFHPEINYSFEELGNYTAGLASYSGDCPLPGTETNKRFFHQYYDVAADTKFDANKKVEVEIYADSALIFTGYLKLESVAMADDNPTFVVSFHETTRDFSDAIRDTALQDLDWSEFNHIRNINNITDSWTAELGRGYVYPKEITGNYDSAATTFTWQWNPATYVKTIWDKTFEAAGFTYSSDFLESEYFRRLIIPYGKSAVEMTEEQIQLQTLRIGVDNSKLTAFQSGSTLPANFNAANDGAVQGGWLNKYGIALQDSGSLDFNDAGGQWNGDEWIATEAGFYDVDFHAPLAFKYNNPLYNTFFLDEGELRFTWVMLLVKQNTGGGVIIADSGRSETNPYGLQTFIPFGDRTRNLIYTDEALSIDMAASNVWMDPGDKIYVKFSFQHPSTNVWKDAPGSISGITVNVWPMILRNIGSDFTYFSARPSSNTLMSDNEIVYSQLLPQLNCVDFVEDVKTMFNLVFRPDRTNPKNIFIEPYDTWMSSRQSVKNWDEKLDHAEYEIIPTATEVAQTYLYTYQEDGDYFNRKYQESTGKVYGEQRLVTTNDINTDTEEVKVDFAATPVASAFDATRFVQPWYVDIQTSTDASVQPQVEAASVKPRILFYGGLQPAAYTIQSTAVESPTSFTEYPYAGHWDHPTAPRWDLNWGLTEAVNWTTSVAAAKTLFTQFHRNALQNRIDANSRILKGQFTLNAVDVADLDPRDRIYCLGSYWRVLDLRWIDSKTLASATLLRVLDLSESPRTTYAVPDTVSTCPTDLVAKKSANNNYYYYSSRSGQRVTEACCNGLGGNWTDGLCIVPNVAPPKPSTPGSTPYTSANISLDRNQIIAQRGSVGKASGVSIRGAGNLASSRTSNVTTVGSNNLYNNNDGIITLGSDNALNNVYYSIVVGNANAVYEPDSNLPSDSTRAFIFGDANTINPGISKVAVFGSNMTAATSSTTYIQNLKMSGNIEASGIIYGTASYALNSPGGGGTAVSASYADKALHAENILMYVQNNTGAAIPKGKVVIISGSVGDNPLVQLADYNSERQSAYTVGFTYEAISNGGQGRVLTEGRLVGIDTTGFTGGDLLYLGASGSFTKTEPTPPQHTVRLGQILRVQQNNGVIDVRIDNGYELDELHDVKINGVTTGQVLMRSASVWTNASLPSYTDPIIWNRLSNGNFAVTHSLQQLIPLSSYNNITHLTAPNVKTIVVGDIPAAPIISASLASLVYTVGSVFGTRSTLTYINVPMMETASNSMFNVLPATNVALSGSLIINSNVTASVGWSASKAVMDTRGWKVTYVNTAPVS